MTWIQNLKRTMRDKRINIETLKTKIATNGHSLSRNSIGNIINERNSPKIETLQLIADALEVELWQLFSTPDSDKQKKISGFVEYQNQIYKINSPTELKELFEMVHGKVPEVQPDTKPQVPEKMQIPGDYLVRRIKSRNFSRNSGKKLKSHVLKRYNVTVCNKKDLELPNDLQRDNKIWVFRSKNEEQRAKAVIKEELKYNFNAQ